ncbi:MAG: NAD(P)/FAD-dependent oxidoreductase [Candidatus Aminicenantales bacterium]
MKKKTDVLVVGGGIIGVCAAYYLSKQGAKVTLVEKGEIASGCSGANAGLIVPSFSIPLSSPGALSKWFKLMMKPESSAYIKPRFNFSFFSWLWQFRKNCTKEKMLQGIRVLHELSCASMQLFKSLIRDESLQCEFQQNGWLMTFRREKEFQKALEEARLLSSYGIESKILTAEETLKMAPALRPGICGAIFHPDDAHLETVKFISSLSKRFQERGGIILSHTEVIDLEASDSNINCVRTTSGILHPDYVVITAGAWSPSLVRKLGPRLPVQPAKGYIITVERPGLCSGIPLYFTEAKVAAVSSEHSLRFAGTLEMSGMDLSLNMTRINKLKRAVEIYYKDVEGLERGKIACGLRPCTPDGLPVIDSIPGYKNLFLATGHGMLGVTLAPFTGKLICQLILGQSTDIDLTQLKFTRFRKGLNPGK